MLVTLSAYVRCNLRDQANNNVPPLGQQSKHRRRMVEFFFGGGAVVLPGLVMFRLVGGSANRGSEETKETKLHVVNRSNGWTQKNTLWKCINVLWAIEFHWFTNIVFFIILIEDMMTNFVLDCKLPIQYAYFIKTWFY